MRHDTTTLQLSCTRNYSLTPDFTPRCLTGPAYRVAEKESYMKSADIRSRVYKVICHAVKLHGHRFDAQASIIQCLQYFEHLAEPMAELVSQLATEYNHPQLGDGLLSDIAEKSFSSQDSKGPRVFSKFLIKYAEEAPEVVFNKRDLLMVHLDSEVSQGRFDARVIVQF